MKILVVGEDRHYASWIDRELEFLESKIENVQQADLVMFTGGEDISPSYYNSTSHPKTHSNAKRDAEEFRFFNQAKGLGVNMIGVCRGSQFLTAMQSGGCLIQHVEGHAVFSPHEIEFSNGKRMLATSTHHQMMYPWNVKKHEIIAWSASKLSDVYEFSSAKDSCSVLPNGKEPEIVMYWTTKCLAIQSHPETMAKDSLLVKELNDLLKEKLGL